MFKEDVRNLLCEQLYVEYIKTPLGLTSYEIANILKKKFDSYYNENKEKIDISKLLSFSNSDNLKRLSNSIGGNFYSSGRRGRITRCESFFYKDGGVKIYYLSGDGSGRIIHEMLDIDDRNGKPVMNSANILKKIIVDENFEIVIKPHYRMPYDSAINKLIENSFVVVGNDGKVVPTEKAEFIFSPEIVERFERLKTEEFRIDFFK